MGRKGETRRKTGGRRAPPKKKRQFDRYNAGAGDGAGPAAAAPIPDGCSQSAEDIRRHGDNRQALKNEFIYLRHIATNVAAKLQVPAPSFPLNGDGSAVKRADEAERILAVVKAKWCPAIDLTSFTTGPRFAESLIGKGN